MTAVDHAAALRDHLSRYPPSDGFHLVDVRGRGDEVAVVFRWQRNRHTFVIHFGTNFSGVYGDEDADLRMGDELTSWCEDVGFWLMEELGTGHLTRATRHRDGEDIVLTTPTPTDGTEPRPGVWVGDVPQYAPEMTVPWPVRLRMSPWLLWARLRGRSASFGWSAWAPADVPEGDGRTDGEWLREAGLDPTGVRLVRDEGRLLAWLQALGKGSERLALGQCAVVSTDDPDVALVQVLKLADGAPAVTRTCLVESAVHAAADAGTRAVHVPGAGGAERIDTALC